MGHFESGSTIVMFTTGDFEFFDNITEGMTIRVGEPLLKCPTPISQAIGETDERYKRHCA